MGQLAGGEHPVSPLCFNTRFIFHKSSSCLISSNAYPTGPHALRIQPSRMPEPDSGWQKPRELRPGGINRVPKTRFLKLGTIKPKFNELTAYQAALTVIFLGLYRPSLVPKFFQLLGLDRQSLNDPARGLPVLGIFFLLLLVLGCVLSIVHVFTPAVKTPAQKFFMGCFAIFSSGFAGLMATVETLPAGWSLLLVFPLWNTLWGMALIDQLAAPHEAILDENASTLDVVTATSAVLFTVYFSQSWYDFSWAVTFSISLSFASLFTFFADAVGSFFARYL